MRRLLLAASLLLLAIAAPAAAEDRPGWTPVDCNCAGARSIEAVSADLLFLGTTNGINRSTDGGFTWRVLSTPISREVRRVSFANERDGAAIGDFEGVIVTHDGGDTWKQYRPWPGRSTDVTALEGRLYGLSTTGLYASTDGGLVWKRVPAELLGDRPRMDWSSPTSGIVVAAPNAYTTTDGTTFTKTPLVSLFLFDALSPDNYAIGQDSVHSGRPWVVKVPAKTSNLPARGVADEQERGISKAGGAIYVVGVEGLIARSTDDGASWAYEKTPPSYERAGFYDVASVDADHAWIAVWSGRVLIRNAPRIHDITTHPNRTLGVGLLGLTTLGVIGAVAAGATGRRPVAAGLTATAVVVGGAGVFTFQREGSCPASGCTAISARSDLGAVETPAPTTSPTASPTSSPTPSATPSATPTATPTPTPTPTASATTSPTPSPTASPTPSPTKAGTFTAVLTRKVVCSHNPNDPNQSGVVQQAAQITLSNTTAATVGWSATAREKLPATQGPDIPWAAVQPGQGSTQKGAKTVVTVTPDSTLCNPGRPPTTAHVDVKHGGKTISVAITVAPET